MGRELRRKKAKREGKSLEKEQIKEKNQIKNLVKITCILVFIVALIYIISVNFITKEANWFNTKKDNNTNENTSSVKNSILASSIFKQSEEEYYVYFYDFNEEDTAISNIINSKLSDSKVYKVDTSSALNANYVSEESNKSAKTLEDLKVSAPTLIKISGDEIVKYYEKDEIKDNL